jgi:diguanylate cyclase (GGDEF)-like protein/PAS domain S-box-containing protein
MVNEAEVRDTAGGAEATQALGSAFAADPLRGSRSAKRWTRIGVYLAILGYGPLYLFVFGYELRQVFTSWTVGLIIATIATELAFAQVFKLRKRGAYPGVLLAELGSGRHLNSAAQHCLGVIQRLMGTHAAFLALCSVDDDFDLVSVSGMGREDAERFLQAGVREVREAMRSRQPVPFKLPGGRSAETGVSRKERLVFIPVVALQEPIGVLAVAGHRRNPDLKDDELLSSVGVALGLSLDSLRQGESLRESEERYRELFENANDIVYTYTLKPLGKITSVNKAGERVTGYTLEDLSNLTVAQLAPPKYHERVAELVKRQFAGEAPTTAEVEVIAKDGRRVWLETSPRLIVKDGKPVAVHAIARDITERKRAEAALRSTEERLHTVIASTPIVLFALDREGTFMLAEGKGLDTLGFHPGHVLGRSVFEQCRDLPQVLENVHRAFAGESFTTTLEVNGRVLEAWLSPVRDQNDELSGITGVVTDITERVRSEEALRATQERLRTVVAGAPIVMFAADRDGVITLAEGKGLEALGLKPDQVIGQSIFDIYRDTPQVRENFHRALAGDTFTSVAEVGGVMFEAWEAPLRDQNGEITGITGVVTDITDRKRAEEALQESETKFRTLAETISAAAFIFQGTRLRYVNSASEKLTGYSREELLAMNFWDVIHPDSRELVKQRGLARQRGEDVPREYETKLLTKSGEERWAEFAVGLIEFEGQPAVMGTGFDITERKRAEDALRQSEERYRLLADNVTDMIWTRDLSLRPTYTSPSVTRLRGHTVEEAMAQTLEEVLTPDSLQVARRTLAEELAKESAEDKDLTRTRTLELEMYRKDGSTIWTEMTVTFLRDEEGRPTGIMGVTRDISERKKAQEALRDSEELYRTLVETSPDAITLTDLKGKILLCNQQAAALHGAASTEDMLGRDALDFIVPEERQRAAENTRKTLQAGSVRNVEYTLLTRDGRRFPGEISASLVVGAEGEPRAFIGVVRDISDHKRAEETIRHLAYHDALTALPNRTLFQDRLAVALAQARRKKRMLAVLFLDLDHFKVVNDTVGHAEGDELLQRVAERLTALVREGDTVARVGGDEFTLLFPEIGTAGDAAEIGERVLAALQQPWSLDGHEFHVTTSVGIAMYPADGDDAESLLRNADTAMYRAKDQGRNNYQLYTPAMNARIVERLALENSLRHGLERGEFVVYYQPQVNIRTGQVVGVEALVRWQHPEQGLVLPAEFIPAAEETGLIVPLGEWVLRTACAQNKAWQEDGLPPMRVAVNLSARQFQQRNLIDVVAQAVRETGLSPHLLQLEITEGIAMQDVDFTVTMMRSLRDMGVQIAIDDFGTGYSSLAYLKRFPIDAVKIDRSFVCDLTVDPNDAAIATTVITMAHSLKLSVIAEGVETEEQLAFLKQRQCDEMQGFLFSKAVPAGVLEKTVRTDGRRPGARTAVDST